MANGDVLVIGICGATNGGKTTLTGKVQEKYDSITHIVHQDNFYKKREEIPVSEDGKEKLWDVPEAIDVGRLTAAVELEISQAREQSCRRCNELKQQQLVLVDGSMILSMREVRPFLDYVYFITLDYNTMKERRSARAYGEKPDPPGYFDNYVWPSYMRDMKVACGAHQDGTVRMLDGSRDILDNLSEVENVIDGHRQQHS